jgi:hypothetical protein
LQNAASKQIGATDLFDPEPENYTLPALHTDPLDDAYDELEFLGFSLCDPFTLVDTQDFGNSIAATLMQQMNKRVSIMGYLVTTKDTRTIKGERMHFGTFYDRKGKVFDTVNFPPVARKYPFKGRGFYRIIGTVVEDFGYPMIEVDVMEKIPMKQRSAPANNRLKTTF